LTTIRVIENSVKIDDSKRNLDNNFYTLQLFIIYCQSVQKNYIKAKTIKLKSKKKIILILVLHTAKCRLYVIRYKINAVFVVLR